MRKKVPLIIICIFFISPLNIYAQWLADRYDSGRSGYYPANYGDENTIIWQHPFDFMPQSIVTDGVKVYVTIPQEDKVVALNIITGEEIWSYDVSNPKNLVIVDDMILVGCVAGVKVLSTSGSLLWKIMEPISEGIIAVSDYIILVDSYSLVVYSLDTREKLWEKTFGTEIFLSNIAVSEERVYLYKALELYAFNLTDGEEVYSIDVPASNAMLVYSDGKVYIGTSDGEMICINAEDGEILWNFETDGKKSGQTLPEALTPAVGGGNIVFAAFDDILYCLDYMGNLKWKATDIDLYFYNQPSITDNKVYLIGRDNILRCINLANGQEVWRIGRSENGLKGDPTGNPILTGGYILGSTRIGENGKHYLFCILAEGAPPPTVSTTSTQSTNTTGGTGTPSAEGTITFAFILILLIIFLAIGLYSTIRSASSPTYHEGASYT